MNSVYNGLSALKNKKNNNEECCGGNIYERFGFT